MPGARKKYRVILSELDSKGIMISIVRVCEKNYNFIINGEIVKNYKKRESANKRLLKLQKKYKAITQ